MTHVGDLVVRISARRQQLDQAYYEDLRELRQEHAIAPPMKHSPRCGSNATPSLLHRESKSAGRSIQE